MARRPAMKAAVFGALAAVLSCAAAYAGIGGAASKHNFKEVPGFSMVGVCPSCHTPHADSGKRLWAGDRERPGDRLRNLSSAKAQSRDQKYGEHAGIYLCLDCHSASPAAPTWAKKTGYEAASVVTHSTREMRFAGYSTKYPQFTVECADCHDPHQSWTGGFQQGMNGYMIRPVIRTPGGQDKTVVFTAMTGPGSMGPNTTHQSVCEVCHTQTLYHKNTDSAAHHDREDCSACHSHASGFAGRDCAGCHGNPPVGTATLVGGSANPGSPSTGSSTAGKHAFHTRSTAGGMGYPCERCHGGMALGKNEDKVIDLKFTLAAYTSGGFDGFAPINGYSYSPGNTAGGSLECRNTYCHGNFKGGDASNRPVWNVASTGACGTCHAVAPPGLQNHSVHLTAQWGPKAACDDCHPAGSTEGRHASHVDGAVSFKDGQGLAGTTVCNNCHGCTAQTKPVWGNSSTTRGATAWCESCHDGKSTVNTAAGTGGADVTAPDVVGNGLYGFEVTGHGRTGISMNCTDCHSAGTPHIDGKAQTYSAALGNYQAGYRLVVANAVPLLTGYSSSKVQLCFKTGCHIENRVLGMPPEGVPSSMHVHSIPISTDKWYTNFRNMSTYAGRKAGNWDMMAADADVPTNIHWNHMDAFGSVKWAAFFNGMPYDSDGDASHAADSYITCKACHNPHGTNQPAMVHDDFSLKTYSVLQNKSVNPTYRWIGSGAYITTRCTEYCHINGDSPGTAGTRWYREPSQYSTVFGVPVGLRAEPLP